VERHESLVEQFDAVRRASHGESDAVRARREAAFASFVSRGFPTTRDEEWRFTNVAPIADTPFVRPAAAALTAEAVDALSLDGMLATIVIVNGRWSEDRSRVGRLPAGVAITRARGGLDSPAVFAPAPTGTAAFADLNEAFVDDAVVIDIAPRTVVEAPIHLIFVAAAGDRPALICPRVIVRAGEQAQASVIESYVTHGDSGDLVNAVTHVDVGAQAFVDHVKLQQQGLRSFHVGTMTSRIDRAGRFTSHAVAVGARIARNDIVALLDGEGAECTLNGLYVGTGTSLIDNHTTIDHAKAHCPSHEVYKGILSGQARAVFNGKIVVRPDAQKTDAKQTNKALLLTDDAQINTKPQLEIFADDVKCTHGAAIGQLDEDALFYLQARGIDTVQARNMLIHAFAGDVLRGIVSPALRDMSMRLVDDKLAIG
jgi:Fe-S cluster assembly protein SufD